MRLFDISRTIFNASSIFTSCKDLCDPNPCANNGTCTKHNETYTCTCPANFTGKNCDKGMYKTVNNRNQFFLCNSSNFIAIFYPYLMKHYTVQFTISIKYKLSTLIIDYYTFLACSIS